jgi:hypothetical protein
MKMTAKCIMLLAFLVLLCQSEAFSSTILGPYRQGIAVIPRRHQKIVSSLVVVKNSVSEEDNEEAATTDGGEKKISLEEKMKKWEATEEEIKAATLGGIVPQQRERTEAFDVGLYIAFPIMVITGLAFAFFPLIMGNIDLGDLEVPRV